MFRNVLAAMAVALTTVAASQGLRAQRPRVPTAEALAASEGAQQHIGAAMELARSDLIAEASHSARRRVPGGLRW